MRELPGTEGILFVVMVKQEMCSFVSSKSKELVLAYISPDCALCYCSHLGFISGSLCREFVCWDLSYSWIHSFLRPLSHRLLSCEQLPDNPILCDVTKCFLGACRKHLQVFPGFGGVFYVQKVNSKHIMLQFPCPGSFAKERRESLCKKFTNLLQIYFKIHLSTFTPWICKPEIN